MKNLGEVLLSSAAGSEVLMGNSALVRAMVESGVRVATAYPGSPTPEIADAILALPADRNPIYFEYSTNEKVATEVAFGAAVNGHLACVFFKSVGLNVAADSFVQLGLMEIIGGLVIVLGDDPGANSSQNEQDNRHLARLAYIPVFEPAGPQEAYAQCKLAAHLARERRMPVVLRLTTHVCHAKERVHFDAWSRPPVDDTPRFDPRHGPYIPLTTEVFPLKRRALEKLAAVAQWSEQAPVHRLEPGRDRRRGVLTAGLPSLSLLDALAGVAARPDVLKLGVVFPLPKELLATFLAEHEEVKVIEELDDFLEQQLAALAHERGLSTRIRGKLDLDDWLGEYTPARVAGLLRKTWPDLLPPPAPALLAAVTAPARPAQLCPGCGHRSAFHAIQQALAPDTITVADIGCHTLGFLPPYRLGQVLLCMGHVSGTAAGLSLFNASRPVVGFLGDSTFFHAGLPGIVNAVYNRHNFTLVLMENGTTAMTGHQELPSSGRNAREAVEKIPVRQVLAGLGVTDVAEVDAYQQAKLTELVRAATQREGFKVIIAKHPCMLKLTRENRRKGRKPQPPVRIGDKCTRQLTCITEFGCPSFQRDADGRITVHTDLCIGDGSCRQTCAAGAIEPTRAAASTEQ